MRASFSNAEFPAHRGLAACLAAALLCSQLPAQQQPAAQNERAIRVSTELVLVNVTVRDRGGNLVRDLKREDFTVLEDNKTEQIVSFDLENTDAIPPQAVEQAKVLTAAKPAGNAPAANPAVPAADLKDRRLLVLFFDLSAMQPDDIDRAVTAAQNYVDKQMAPADLVAVVSLGSSLRVNQDFTADRDLLKKALKALSPTTGQGLEEGATGTTEGTPDTAQPFTADDTEFNIFNTDRRLDALRSLSASLSPIRQKKSLIYFSSGMDRTGIENQSELRAAINAAVRSNLAIYTMDIRGLQALVPGGEAQNASLRGVAPYSGQATLNALSSNTSTQETLYTLAGDTGGRAITDTNDFGQVFTRVQQDTSSYYILGYQSGNPARDGHYRRITVRVNRPGVKMEFRHGYYAPADFQHANREDRERQLEEELASELPSTDLPAYLSAAYFRLSDSRFFVPVSLVVPGAAIPFSREKDQDRATLDVLGMVLDEAKRPLGRIRDTVKLAVPGVQEVRRKNVQYNNGFILSPGRYHLKFVVRENMTGRIGSFETDVVVPELKNAPLKMSSVVLATQTQTAGKRRSDNPLIHDGVELIPNVTHVFSSGQHLFLYYEVYDPGRDKTAEPKSPEAKPAEMNPAEAKSAEQKAAHKSEPGIRILSNVAFFRGKVKAYETPLVRADQIAVPGRRAAVFQLDVPLGDLKPGFYTCQVNVIDDAAGHFLFPRLALLIRQP
jgi:VWFA-related protein